MMRISALSLTLLLLGSLAITACSPIKNLQKRESMTQLRNVVSTYRKLMRWGHYDQAAQYLKARDGDAREPDFKDMSRYKITSLTIADEIISNTDTEAKITAYVDFYDTDSGRATSAKDDQFWWYDEMEKRWFLGSPMINFSDFIQ
jgi:hypothetical protein